MDKRRSNHRQYPTPAPKRVRVPHPLPIHTPPERARACQVRHLWLLTDDRGGAPGTAERDKKRTLDELAQTGLSELEDHYEAHKKVQVWNAWYRGNKMDQAGGRRGAARRLAQ